MRTYTTNQIALVVNVHPNTVRLYEEWGYISPVQRKSNGYRIFTDKHLEEMKIARLAFPGPYPVSSKSLFKMMQEFIKESYAKALEYTKQYKNLVREEEKRSKETLRTLDQWHKGRYGTDKIIAIGRKKFAHLNGVSIETIRNWERNGLYEPTINSRRYKQYSELDYEKVQIIRLLRKTGFSIASLAKLFHSDQEHMPSYFLEKIYHNHETSYEADEWLKHLEEHINRADAIIDRILMKTK